MSEKMKKILWIVLAIAVVVVCGYSFLTSDLEHIEDTNGPEDISLTTITDQDLIDRNMGNMGLGRSTNTLSSSIKFHSDKFTGVYEVMWTEVLFSTGFTLDIHDFEVKEGNFKMVVLVDDEIAGVIEPGLTTGIDLGEIKGDVSLVIAGESADFSFKMFEHDYNSYSHPK